MNNALKAQPNQTPVSSVCSRKEKNKKKEQKPHDMKNDHVGWDRKFAADVFYGYGM